MSKNMVERVARRLHGNLFATITDWRDELGTWEGLPDHARNAFMYTARIVIEEMREPTERMRKAAYVESAFRTPEAFRAARLDFAPKEAWRAMIAAALK